MKVAIDISRMHNLSLNRGIGVYAKNLYSALKKYTDIEVELISVKSDLSRFDLIHQPFFDFFINSLKINFNKLLIITIHDLIPIMFPSHYPPGLGGKINWQLQKIALKRVKSVIAVSKTVREDIENFLKVDPKKISVVYSAPSEAFLKISQKSLLKETKDKYKLPDDFVLYIGNVNWNKNILNMTEAVINNDKNLVIIGSAFLDKNNLNHPEKKSLKLWLEKYGENDNIKILGFLNEDEVVKIMNLAKCLIFPSFYEGFGLPILEAQSCALPVLTSNMSATKEVAGEGAFLVDPGNIKYITEGINAIYSSEQLREKLITLGFNNLKRFSWQKTALKTAEVYKNAFK